MLVRVLGSAAGGGFPQWNCRCENCRRARADDTAVAPRTQASLAVSADGARWVLLNASPDLPAQLRAARQLQPDTAGPPRNSPIAAVVISGGDIDCIAGLLSLREGHAFTLYAPMSVQKILSENRVFAVLNPSDVRRETLAPGCQVALCDGVGGPLGLRVGCFAVPGKIPLYHESLAHTDDFTNASAVIGLSVQDRAGSRLLFIPGCAQVTDPLLDHVANSNILFFDGTLWQDDEMIRAGLGTKTGARMGHISVSGPNGTLAAFSGIRGPRKILIHINNTNPILCKDSEEAKSVRSAGWEIAHDGMELTL